jgi:hypothetical protein
MPSSVQSPWLRDSAVDMRRKASNGENGGETRDWLRWCTQRHGWRTYNDRKTAMGAPKRQTTRYFANPHRSARGWAYAHITVRDVEVPRSQPSGGPGCENGYKVDRDHGICRNDRRAVRTVAHLGGGVNASAERHLPAKLRANSVSPQQEGWACGGTEAALPTPWRWGVRGPAAVAYPVAAARSFRAQIPARARAYWLVCPLTRRSRWYGDVPAAPVHAALP